MTEKLHQPLPDKNQSIWQLAAIQLSGWTSLPILATSVLVMKESGFYGAIFTIIVGNAIAWFIRLGIIAMSHKNRQSTLDISKEYLGSLGGYFIAAFLILSTLAWFIAQTTAASNALTHLITIKENPSIDKFTQMSVLLGIISTFLCIEGMVLLRRLSTLIFPFLLIAFIIAVYVSPFTFPAWTPPTISIAGLSLVLVTNLGITSDLPTFFRHSRSLHISITALTVIQLSSLVLALCGLYFGSIITSAFEINEGLVLGTGNEILRLALIGFVFMSVICANVANVYSASVGWELIAPKALVGRKEYLIFGLGLTMIFILTSNLFSTEFLLNVTDYSLVNLCIVLIGGYIASRVEKKAPSPFQQKGYFLAWLLATSMNTLQFTPLGNMGISPLIAALGIIAVCFLLLYVGKMFSRPSRFSKA